MPLLVNPAVGFLPTSQDSSSKRLVENTQFLRQSENHLMKPAAQNRRDGLSSEAKSGWTFKQFAVWRPYRGLLIPRNVP